MGRRRSQVGGVVLLEGPFVTNNTDDFGSHSRGTDILHRVHGTVVGRVKGRTRSTG